MGGDARLRWVFATRFARLSQARFGSPLRSCVPSFRDCPWRMRQKPDTSLGTRADMLARQVICAALSREHPEIPVQRGSRDEVA
jgi:hypothetical protein